VTAMVRAAIQGIQGTNISNANNCACSLKHFIGYPDPVYVPATTAITTIAHSHSFRE